jgi:ElaB/YqjD/DUF883 family membrane-anchored ribosome-binding protein
MAITSKIEAKETAPTVEDIEAQLAELRREISALTKNLAAYGSAKVDDYRAGVDKLAADTVNASLNAINAAKDEAMSLEDAFEQKVRARPLQSIGIALGVGFLAALLTRR